MAINIMFSRRSLIASGLAAITTANAQPAYRTPGVYIDEIDLGPTIEAAETSRTLFITGPAGEISPLTLIVLRSVDDFLAAGGPDVERRSPEVFANIASFFANGGGEAQLITAEELSISGLRAAIASAASADFEIAYIPQASYFEQANPFLMRECYAEAEALCASHYATLLVDGPDAASEVVEWRDALGIESRNIAAYASRIETPYAPFSIGVCAAVAGVIARTDSRRGVWRAPAGVEASLMSATPSGALTTEQGEALGLANVNPVLTYPGGHVIWGSRTLSSDPDWQYLTIHRTTRFVEKSIRQSTEWTAAQSNDEALWTNIRSSIERFLSLLSRQGAFIEGGGAADAFFVRCGQDTTSQTEIDAGVVNVEIGMAVRRPGEYLILRLPLEARAS